MNDYGNMMVEYAKEHTKEVVILRDVGIGENGFAIGTPGMWDDYTIGYNLRIVDRDAKMVKRAEWCDSLQWFVEVRRPFQIRARFVDVNGETNTLVYGGKTARLLQHALDRINGVRISSVASYIDVDRALKSRKQAGRKKLPHGKLKL